MASNTLTHLTYVTNMFNSDNFGDYDTTLTFANWLALQHTPAMREWLSPRLLPMLTVSEYAEWLHTTRLTAINERYHSLIYALMHNNVTVSSDVFNTLNHDSSVRQFVACRSVANVL
jgi:hypothetical protein